MKKYLILPILIVLVGVAGLVVSGCGDDKADIASENISKACDNFECVRKITFINSITDAQYLTIEGRCNIEDETNQLEVTCLQDDDTYVKDFLGLSDNVTYVVEQQTGIDVSDAQYRVTFAPKSLVPDIHTP